MNEDKKRWQKPELIAIVRCKTEENVLSACKTSVGRGSHCGNENGATSTIALS